ncbi:GDSL-LIKE LIPASE/ACYLHYDROLASE [Salix koriyanagi]|uniref:GDSL-LIKE LIPASE/ACYLHYDROLASE n=1 Tax=Salix koriyanagi TaxID=2511006 RepID=A0A9Q0PXY0_9ROSI|nr:GDSL-LIKE LIPASE/ACYLHYDROLASE [Salix koriyanagi]
MQQRTPLAHKMKGGDAKMRVDNSVSHITIDRPTNNYMTAAYIDGRSVVFVSQDVFLIPSPMLEFLFATPKLFSFYKNWQKIVKHAVAFFIFGDSFLDAGNNNYINTTTLDQANFWPYGETYFEFPTGRFSDGRLVPDFIAKYANLPFIPPFLQPGMDQYYHGVNFASAGAGALVETFKGDVIDLKTQLRYYKKVENWLRHKLGNDEARMTISKAVHLFSIGSNDYLTPFLTNSTALKSYTNSKYVGMVIGNLTTVVKEIYRLGGRKFAFINHYTTKLFPSSSVNLEKRLKGFKHSLFDLNSFLEQRINHPSKFGFRQGKSACCGTGPFRGVFSCGGRRLVKQFELCENPNEYVFWDSIHLTEQAYKQLADQMWGGGVGHPHVLGPYNLMNLFQT